MVGEDVEGQKRRSGARPSGSVRTDRRCLSMAGWINKTQQSLLRTFDASIRFSWLNSYKKTRLADLNISVLLCRSIHILSHFRGQRIQLGLGNVESRPTLPKFHHGLDWRMTRNGNSPVNSLMATDNFCLQLKSVTECYQMQCQQRD